MAPTVPMTALERVEAVGRIELVARRALGDGGIGVIGNTMSAVTFLPHCRIQTGDIALFAPCFRSSSKRRLPV